MRITTFLLFLLAFMFSGCAIGAKVPNISQTALEKAGVAGAPTWVLTNGDGFYSAVGTEAILNQDVTGAVSKATDNARIELAKSLNINISGNASNRSSIVQDIEAVKLSNTKAVEIWITPDGSRVYILLKMKEDKGKGLSVF